MGEPTKVEVKPWTKRDTLKVLGGGILGLFGLGKVASRVGDAIEKGQQESAMDKRNEILSHQAKILETDDTLGVENALAQFQIQCKGVDLSTFVLTAEEGEYPNKWPRVFTEVNGKTIELLMTRGDGYVDWYIPGTDSTDGEKGIKGAVGAEFILRHQDKYVGNNDNVICYWPPYDGKAELIGFKEDQGACKFLSSELPQKVKELLFT